MKQNLKKHNLISKSDLYKCLYFDNPWNGNDLVIAKKHIQIQQAAAYKLPVSIFDRPWKALENNSLIASNFYSLWIVSTRTQRMSKSLCSAATSHGLVEELTYSSPMYRSISQSVVLAAHQFSNILFSFLVLFWFTKCSTESGSKVLKVLLRSIINSSFDYEGSLKLVIWNSKFPIKYYMKRKLLIKSIVMMISY